MTRTRYSQATPSPLKRRMALPKEVPNLERCFFKDRGGFQDHCPRPAVTWYCRTPKKENMVSKNGIGVPTIESIVARCDGHPMGTNGVDRGMYVEMTWDEVEVFKILHS